MNDKKAEHNISMKNFKQEGHDGPKSLNRIKVSSLITKNVIKIHLWDDYGKY